MSETKYKRSWLPLVDLSYQLRFVTRILMIICSIALVSSLFATAILWKNMYRPELESQSHIVSALIGISVFLLIELLISIPIVYFLGIRQSHQVVGPLKRMNRAIESIGNGDFSPRLVLRQGDVLEDLSKTINQMAENLQKRFPGSTPPPRTQ